MQETMTVNDIDGLRRYNQPFPYMGCEVKCNKCGAYAPISAWRVYTFVRKIEPGEPMPKKHFTCAVCRKNNVFANEIHYR